MYFFDEELFQRPLIHYYLFYAVGTHSYHSPLQMTEDQVRIYAKEQNLEIIDIDKLDTRGDDIIGLGSTSFTALIVRESPLLRSPDGRAQSLWVG